MVGYLKDVAFTDLYLGGGGTALMSGVTGTSDPIPVPDHLLDEAKELRMMCESDLASHGREDFAVKFGGSSYRASVIRSLSDTVFVLRKFGNEIPLLGKLGIHQRVVENVMKQGLTGLLIVSGAYGQGKTTTASSIVVSRTSTYGGIAVTIEDPPEMPLEGKHGNGVIYQTWAGKGGFGEACRKATRWAPSIIFLGEVRDGETAIEALRASINGRLVVCTTHSDNPIGAIERMHALASSEASSDDTTQLLSHGLAGVLHQSLEDHGGRKQLFVNSLWLDEDDGPGIRATILQKRLNQLDSFIGQQRNKMLSQRQTPKQ